MAEPELFLLIDPDPFPVLNPTLQYYTRNSITGYNIMLVLGMYVYCIAHLGMYVAHWFAAT